MAKDNSEQELSKLRRDLRKVTRDISQLKRDNKYLKDKMRTARSLGNENKKQIGILQGTLDRISRMLRF